MTLGQKIRAARLEAGLSQRQLCGDTITRNMLSQIENGSANPSVATLQFLAAGLGKPLGYFLEEDTVSSPNPGVMQAARQCYSCRDYGGALAQLRQYRSADPVFDEEKTLLTALCHLALARQAAEEGRTGVAKQHLSQIPEEGIYLESVRRQRLLLLGHFHPEQAQTIAGQLPSMDAELLIRAAAALEQGEYLRCKALLEAAELREDPYRDLLLGEALLALRDYARATTCLHKAEAQYPHRTAPALEQCYRELEDFKQAYFYACKARNLSGR